MTDLMTDLIQPRGGAADHPARAPRRSFWPAVLGTARLEFTLTTRSLAFWFVQLAVLGSTLLVLMPDGFSGSFLRFSSQQLRQFLAFALLLLPLLAWPGLQRLQGERGDLVLVTTHDNVAHALGTMLGMFSWLVPATLLQLLARWLMGELVGGQANWTLLLYGPGLALASLTLGLGFLAFLSLVWRRILPVLLVWLGLWVLTLYGAGGLLGGFVGPYMPLFSSWNVFYEGLLLSPAAGLVMAQPLVTKLAISLAVLGLALLAAWVALAPSVDSRRANRRRHLPTVALLVALSLVVLTQAGFQREVSAQQPAMTPRSTELDAWRVMASELEVAIDPRSDAPIAGAATMTLRAAGGVQDVLTLRLRPGIHLSASSNGQELSVTREGDSVHVQLRTLDLGPDADLEIQLAFEGAPQWPYSDHRFQTGGAFPVLDSNQPITSAFFNDAGYLLRDGDWRPWPWTTEPLIAEDQDVLIIRANSKVTRYDGPAPQLLVALPPRRKSDHEKVITGTDPSAGLLAATHNVAAGAERLWEMLGEAAPQVVALPYLPDVYANLETVVLPEAYDLSHDLQVGAAYQRNMAPELTARAGYVLAARAWLNGNARHPRAYAEATVTRSAIQGANGFGPGAGSGYRLLQLSSMGPLGSRWSELWHGADPSLHAIEPFALWIGMELAEPDVRRNDLASLRQLTGDASSLLELRQRGLPWNLTRQPSTVALVLALSDWSDAIGGEEAVRLFAQAYTTTESQDHENLLAALESLSGIPVALDRAGGLQ
ncbi:MAG: hypothetical protein WDA03_05225 [Trueperaceae bacterium]